MGQKEGNFLTEQEEDEIIDQMKRQTPTPGLEQEQQNGSNSHSPLFTGTDGFGATEERPSFSASTDNGASTSADRIGSLTDSLGDLRSMTHSTSSGGLFSGRSSERDNAYLRKFHKGTKVSSPIEEASEEDEASVRGSQVGHEEPTRLSTEAAIQEDEEEDDDDDNDGVDTDEDQVAMPGAFTSSRPSSKRSSKRNTLRQSAQAPPQIPRLDFGDVNGSDEDDSEVQSSRDAVPGNRAKTQSQLLSTLSPEAFRRVSTALEEVIGIISPNSLPHVEDDTVDSDQDGGDYEIGAVSASDTDGELSRHARQQFSSRSSAPSVAPSNHNGATNDNVAAQRYTPNKSSAGHGDSDSASFRSAEDASGQQTAASEPTTPKLPQGEASTVREEPSLLDAGQRPVVEPPQTPTLNGDAEVHSSNGPAPAVLAATSALDTATATKSGALLSPRASTPPPSRQPPFIQNTPRSTPAAGQQPSPVSATVLSAEAIAARSQRYFPQRAAALPEEYASGFRASPGPGALSRLASPPSTSASNASHALAAATGTPVASPQQRTLPGVGSTTETPRQTSQESAASVSRMPYSDRAQQNQSQGGPGQTTYDSRPSTRLSMDDSGDEAQSDTNLSDLEQQYAQDSDHDNEDVWAKVSKRLQQEEEEEEGSERGGAHPITRSGRIANMSAGMRPMSHIAPAEAASEFEGSGFSVDQLAAIQADLVRSASESSGLAGANDPAEVHQQAVEGSRLENARDRARWLATRGDEPISSSGNHSGGSGEGSDHSPYNAPFAAPDAPASSSTMAQSNSQRSFRSQVLYDVTSSHRPTSPTARTSAGLPSLHDLSMNGFQQRPSISSPRGPPAGEGSALGLGARKEDASGRFDREAPVDQSGYSRQPIAEEGEDSTAGDLTGETVSDSGQDSFLQVREDSPERSFLQLPQTSGLEEERVGAASLTRSPSAHSAVSETGSRRRAMSPALVDDVAAQARAATEALKGPPSNDGGVRLTPRRSRTLSKRKIRKNPGKYISVPELLKTSQQMDHVQAIPASSGATTSPPRPGHVRRSSSFGNSGNLVDTSHSQSPPLMSSGRAGEQRYGSPVATTSPGAKSPLWSAPTGGGSRRAPATPTSTSSKSGEPGTPSSATGLSRFVSRMRIRKPSQEQVLRAASPASPSVTRHGNFLQTSPGPAIMPTGTTPGSTVTSSAQQGISPLDADDTREEDPLPVSTLPESGAHQQVAASQSPALDRSRSPSWQGRSEPSWQGTTSSPLVAGGSKLGSPAMIQSDGFGGFSPILDEGSQDGSRDITPAPAAVEPLQTADATAAPQMPASMSQSTIRDSFKGSKTQSSARNTIVRRTLIFPAAAESEDRRRSVASTAASVNSKRKSTRRLPIEEDDANASYAALLASNSNANGEENSRPSLESRGPASRYDGGGGLRPPSVDGTSTRRTSAGGSYSGSLYDMYIGNGSEGDDGRDSSSIHRAAHNHIEVTERADGSVVWQVIAGLGQRSSMDEAGGRDRHRTMSDSSQPSFAMPRDSIDEIYSPDPGMTRSFTGLLNRDDDTRSLFKRQQKERQEASNVDGNGDTTAEIGAGRGGGSTTPLPPLPPWQPEQGQLAFNMATPGADAFTRIVYSNDGELEQLLENLARQNDAAQFHFDPKQYSAAVAAAKTNSAAIVKASPAIGTSPEGRVDSGDFSSNPDGSRRRVEDEIMTLLMQREAEDANRPSGGAEDEPDDEGSESIPA